MLGSHRPWNRLLPLLLVLSLALGLGCRKELPELFDRNHAPETYVTASPVESLFDNYQVRMHWYGLDPDGEIAYYLWAWTDSSLNFTSAWNPETRPNDRILREGAFDATHLTTRTDSIFTLLANDNNGTSRDLTFNVTAVDDQGKRDPVPARLYFFASVDTRPEIIWVPEPSDQSPDTLWIYASAEQTQRDTVPVGMPFQCRFTGTTLNGYLLGYQWSSGSEALWLPLDDQGQTIWTFQDSLYQDADFITLTFNNDITGADADMQQYYKNGDFPIRAKCLDLAGVQSNINTVGPNYEGALLPVLNVDPDTRLRPQDSDYPIIVTYRDENNAPVTYSANARRVDTGVAAWNFVVDEPIPWGEDNWVEINLQGWDVDDPLIAVDNPSAGQDTIKTKFQIAYTWTAQDIETFTETTVSSQGRFPPGGRLGYPEDLGLGYFGEAGQFFRINVGPLDYMVRGFAIDHFNRVDGTPVTISFEGGYQSIADQVYIGAVGGLDSVDVLAMNPNTPFNIELEQSYFAGFPEELFVWDPATNTATYKPQSVEFVQVGQTIVPFATYQITLHVFGHDDSRNGSSTQLGRIWWNLDDEDYLDDSRQFHPDSLSVISGGFIRSWRPFAEEGDSPDVDGDFIVTLQVTERVDSILPEVGDRRRWLGEKTFSTRMCNTTLEQTFEEKIEGTTQRVLGFSRYGRLSELESRILDIRYKASTLP